MTRTTKGGEPSRRTGRVSAEPRRGRGHAPASLDLLAPGAPLPVLHRLLLLASLVLLAVLATRQVSSPDIGFHLRTGEHILSGNGWPRTDPFTYTVASHRYTDTSWGYDVLLALIHRAAAAPGLVVFHLAVVLATFGVIYRTARLRPVDPTTAVVLVLAAVLCSEMRFSTRPELISYLFLAIELHILHRRAEGLSAPIAVLPALHLVWANMHSLFVLGWAAIACVLVGMAIRDRRIDRSLALAGAAALAAAFVNPYGVEGVRFPFELATRFRSENVFNQQIGEFMSPFARDLPRFFPHFGRLPAIFSFRALAVVSILALVPLARARRWHALLLWLAFAPLALRMFRNMPLLPVAALAATIQALPLAGLFAALPRRFRLAPAARRAAGAALVVGLLVWTATLCLSVSHDAYYVDARRVDRFGLDWNGDEVPVEAVAYATRAGLPGRVLNHLNYGGYLMWARREPVYIDGRLEVMGESFYTDYRRVFSSQDALEECVGRHGIGWMIFPYVISPDLTSRMSKDSRWRLGYLDDVAAVFLRSDAQSAARVDPSAADLEARAPAPIPFATLPGIGKNPRRRRFDRWLAGLTRSEDFPREHAYTGLFHYYRGEYPIAARYFAEAIRESGGAYYEIYNNLGSSLFRLGSIGDAEACYRVVLEEAPKNAVALERLEAIRSARAGRG